ncbi:SpoIID/LytB domain-containing protein [candidate division GN15 bacterium]|nr:SpoIID/LytB domain-containing protein [candidate division GN15 bacterium]
MTSRASHSRTRRGIIPIALRLMAGLFLVVLIWSCASVPGLKDEAVINHIRVPFVRVLLEENTDVVKLTSDASFAIECLQGGVQRVYYSSQPVTVHNRGQLLRVENSRGDVIQEGMEEVNILPRGRGNRIRVNGNRYRGIMKVLPHGQTVRLVNIVYVEDYLRGVVPPEIGPREPNEIEAVKAQAVAARTYTMAHLQQYGAEPYDMKSTIIDQLYQGVEIENDLINKAIDATSGYVLTYEDQFINAYYHSTCGGMTDDIVDVWERDAEPYLKPVADTDCNWSKYYNWKEVFTEPQLRGRLEQFLSRDRGRDLRIAPITDIRTEGLTAGGRVIELQVFTRDDVYRFYKDRIRWVIGRSSNPDLILPSDRFEVKISRDGQGNVTAVTFAGQGYGHGVGMCQCGAIGKSRLGWQYGDILTYFYTGTELKQLY